MQKNRKILSGTKMAQTVQFYRAQHKKIVAISGGMDLLHAGHVFALTEAKKQGDILIVLLNSDASIQLYKGPNRPIVPEAERAFLIASLECVDHVVLFDEINPLKILEKIKPDVYCNSSEWGKDCIERPLIEGYGGRIHLVKRDAGPSTTERLARIRELSEKKDIQAIFIDRDGTINDNKTGYIHTKEEFTFLPGVVTALKKLSQTHYHVFIVTNQSGIGRGLYSERTAQHLHTWLVKELQKQGVVIKKVYYCPHTADDHCLCRKPKSGLLLQAAREYSLNLSKSWIIGNSWVDIASGREANVRTILVGSNQKKKGQGMKPHFTVKGMREAVSVILASS